MNLFYKKFKLNLIKILVMGLSINKANSGFIQNILILKIYSVHMIISKPILIFILLVIRSNRNYLMIQKVLIKLFKLSIQLILIVKNLSYLILKIQHFLFNQQTVKI
jgi:hypothetical protein